MKYGCIAEKLSHSFSKEIHNKLFDYPYELREVAKEDLDSFMRNRDFCAINVTIPYKEAVIPYLDEISPTAKSIGAVNTIVNRGGKLYGYNTDFSGLCALLDRCNISPKGKKVLILGSGGTSKTAYAVAQHLGCRAVYRVSRSGRDGCITYQEAVKLHNDAELIINTTPCGMYPSLGESAVSPEDYPALEAVVDAVYNPLRSKLVCDALEKGLKATGGLFMLVAQAAYAAEKFIGETVLPAKIEDVYQQLRTAKENIVLIGMPGCGKTTIGKELAMALNMEFIDTDEQIVEKDGRPIPQIFSESGESYFRDLETQVILETAKRQNCVIATGGGAVLRKINADMLKENGRVYFLDAPLEALLPTDDRPLSSNRADLERRYTERYDIYCSTCHRRIPRAAIQNTVTTICEDFKHEDLSTQRT